MKRYKKIVCFLLALILSVGCVAQISIPAAAAYENTHTNTGDQIEDIIAVAMTQVGYKEYGPNYTKYGEWWGHNPMAWCAIFVSWCAEQAGIPESVMKQSSFANPSSFGLSGETFYASQRTPARGDLMFKTNGGHVALIYKVSGSKFYTIEGNTYTYADPQEGVMLRERNLYDSGYYFATPRYNSSSGTSNPGTTSKPIIPPSCSHTYIKGAETEHPHKEYYQCSKCGDKYYTGTEKTVDSCKTCKQENCSHRYEIWKEQNETYHSSVCVLCELEKQQAHTWGSDEVLLEPTCVDPGNKKQICEICGAERETEIPPTDEHTFGSYILIDSDIHAMICEVCEKREEAPHTLDGWSASATEHWFECPECRGRINIGKHSIYGSCGTACSICDIVPNTGHMYSAKWTSNAKSHWHRCTNCAATLVEEPHIYSAECDESCNECGYIRHVVHSYSSAWESDDSGHWKTCQKCGQVKEMQSHTPGATATENHAQVCTVCKAEIVPVQAHKHKYVLQGDDQSHWGVCSCGDKLEAEAHVWMMSNGECEICRFKQTEVDTNPVFLGIKLPNVFKTPWAWKIIMFSFGGIILLIVLAILVASIRRLLMAGTAVKLRREFEEEDEYDDEDDWDDEPMPEAEAPAPVTTMPPMTPMTQIPPVEEEAPVETELLGGFAQQAPAAAAVMPFDFDKEEEQENPDSAEPSAEKLSPEEPEQDTEPLTEAEEPTETLSEPLEIL